MDRPSRKLYTHYYLKMLDKQVDLRRAKWPQWNAISKEPRVRTIREFDARYTAPLSGFRNTDHYYSDSSALNWLSSITTPTTILADRDDPIVSYATFADAEVNSQSTRLVTTSRGGHMGYFGIDSRGRSIRWLEHFVTQQIARNVDG
jgi:predicted alpha/beta-fold hydrolase